MELRRGRRKPATFPRKNPGSGIAAAGPALPGGIRTRRVSTKGFRVRVSSPFQSLPDARTRPSRCPFRKSFAISGVVSPCPVTIGTGLRLTKWTSRSFLRQATAKGATLYHAFGIIWQSGVSVKIDASTTRIKPVCRMVLPHWTGVYACPQRRSR